MLRGYTPIPQNPDDVAVLIQENENLRVEFEKLIAALAVSNKEKAVAIIASLITALGVSAGFIIDTYWLITSGLGKDGSGMNIRPHDDLLSKILVAGMGGLSGLFSAPLTCWIYGNYISSEQALMKRIEDEGTAQIALHEKLKEVQFNYFIELLRYRFLMVGKTKEAFQTQMGTIKNDHPGMDFTLALLNLVEETYEHFKENFEFRKLLKKDLFNEANRQA